MIYFDYFRPPSPLVDVNREKIESFDQLSLDLKAAYQNKDISDVICLIGIERINEVNNLFFDWYIICR